MVLRNLLLFSSGFLPYSIEAALQKQFDAEIEKAKNLLQTKYQELTAENEAALQQRIKDLEADKVKKVKAAKSTHRQYERQLHE
ncbi:MAG: hypothetical protein F6J98_34965, partial [Moorea sp. SIO4G2]|nr:hypothetical protein [Moorena sp. SIO4G2]